MIDLRQGDCLELMKDIPDKSIDLVVTDPPYKIVQGGCTNKAVRLKGSNQEQLKKEHCLITIQLNLMNGYQKFTEF